MLSLWILLLYVMADVMPRGHGGDDAEEPPPPGGFGRGHHEADLVPQKKKRGRGKNKKLQELNKTGLVSIPFDRDVTHAPVGSPADMFSRAVGIYMWANFSFEKLSFMQVSEADKNAMTVYLKRRFDFDEIEKDIQANNLLGGIRGVYKNIYKGRKHQAKQHFLSLGGFENETIWENPPNGMSELNWRKTLELFADEKYQKRCEINKLNRQKLKFTNRGGTASHSSWTYKKNQSPLDTYRDAHTLRNGTFASELEENNYNKLKEEFEFQSAQLNQEHPFFEGEDELIGSTPKPNVVGVFEKVLGARSGYYRGLGRKPSISSAASAAGPHHEETRRSRFTEEDYDEIVGDPRFMARILKALKNNKGSTSGTSGNADDADEGEE